MGLDGVRLGYRWIGVGLRLDCVGWSGMGWNWGKGESSHKAHGRVPSQATSPSPYVVTSSCVVHE
jgi:hypothetical protein